MIDYKVIVIISLIFSAWFALAYLDKKYHLRILNWINGEANSPFFTNENSTDNSAPHTIKDDEVKELRERIEVLEKIVTEPAFQINSELKKL